MRQSRRVIAIIGGLGAAVAWAIAVLSSAHSSRLIGSRSTVAVATFLGTLLALPFVVASGPPPAMSPTTVAWLVGSGFASLTGLLLVYRALGMGKIGIVAAVTSTEGAVAAVISILLGERLTVTVLVTLLVVAVGVVVVALASEDDAGISVSRRHVDPAVAGRAIVLGSVAALSFGIGLYGTAQVGNALPLAYAVLPTRVVGTLVLFLPMLVAGKLTVTRRAMPAVVTVAIVEVAGTALYAFGARQSVAIAAVLSSQFAALAALAAFAIYRERLTVRQRSGVIAIAVGVALLAGLRA
jgi:drug/metabolite transporter (DMT)-like permease